MLHDENLFSCTEILAVLGKNIRKAREKKKMGINELAHLAGYSRNQLSNVEFGEKNIRYRTVVDLTRILDVSFPTIFSLDYMEGQHIEQVISTNIFKEDDFLMVFIENFQRELLAQRSTQATIYILTGVSESTLSRILNGKNQNPTIKTMYAMAYMVRSDMCNLFSRNKLEEDI